MQAGFTFLEIGFSRGQERRHRRREDPDQLLDRRARCTGRAASPSPSAARRATSSATHGFFLRDYGDPLTAFPVMGLSDATIESKWFFQFVVLRGLAGDRLGHDARAHQVRRLRHLRDRLLGAHLPDRLALGLRRRLAAGQPRHAGLRRFDGGPPHRRDRRPARRCCCSAPRQGQVRRRRQAAGDPRAQHAAVRPRRASSCWLGWFGFNPGSTLGALDGRFTEVVLVTHLAAAAGVLGALVHQHADHEDDRHRHGRQRRDRARSSRSPPARATSSPGPASSSASSPA